MAQSLAVIYRPKSFEDVVGQEAIRKILKEQITTNTNKNCYLFCGGAGTGKTTCARIFANELNKGKGNPIEIDGASNNGVDNVREIIDNARFKSTDSEYKVYIIDECHMLSTGAWNAMLKLIEEPPAKTMFLFCTTDPQKIPATILSRVQRYDFQRISMEGVIRRLKYIVEEENKKNSNNFIEVDEKSLWYIAKLADGGMRDAITLMDKCISYNNVLTVENVLEALGTSDYDIMFKLTNYLLNHEKFKAMQVIEDVFYEGKDLKQFIKQYTYFVLDLCKIKISGSFEYSNIPEIEPYIAILSEPEYTEDYLSYLLGETLRINTDIKWESSPKQLIEAEFLLLCTI